MNKNRVLPWGEPWQFLFTKKLSQEERKKEMAEIGTKLYEYIEKSLGGKQYFRLQLNWSRSAENSNIFILDVRLVVTHEGVVNWDKTKSEGFAVNPLAALPREGTKPPPPPPAPPRDTHLFSNDAPFEYFSNQYIPYSVLAFSQTGVMTQFNENINESIYG